MLWKKNTPNVTKPFMKRILGAAVVLHITISVQINDNDPSSMKYHIDNIDYVCFLLQKEEHRSFSYSLFLTQTETFFYY